LKFWSRCKNLIFFFSSNQLSLHFVVSSSMLIQVIITHCRQCTHCIFTKANQARFGQPDFLVDSADFFFLAARAKNRSCKLFLKVRAFYYYFTCNCTTFPYCSSHVCCFVEKFSSFAITFFFPCDVMMTRHWAAHLYMLHHLYACCQRQLYVLCILHVQACLKIALQHLTNSYNFLH